MPTKSVPEGHYILRCEVCDSTTIRKSWMQRYCPTCSGDKDAERKAAHRTRVGRVADPRTPEQRKADYQAHKAGLHEAGATLSEPGTMHWLCDVDEDTTAWFTTRVAVPFTYAYSKNAIWRKGKGGHVYMRKEARAARDLLVGRLKGGISDNLFHNRLWLDIMVEKPDHNGDAVNVVDTVCDAVQEATGLDDRWYSIRRLDWRVVKTNPRLIVGISQEATEDAQICSYCGRCLPFDAFVANKSTKTGRSRTCRECDAAARKAKKAA